MYALLREERGGVLVMAVAWLSVLLLVATFVVDTANWFEHKRHLQMQVDAGALAGATNINGCFGAASPSNWLDPANTAIRSTARHYGGDTLNDASAYNPQVTNKANVAIYVNSTKFPGDTGASDGDDYKPCQSDPVDPKKGAFVDLKATDANLPWYLGGSVVPKIRAHARVSIKGIGTLSGSLPLAVEDVNPLATGAIFVNEDSANAVLGSQALTAGTATTLNGRNVIPWTGGPVSITIPARSPASNTG
ncbi:MAG: hypothetical protein QOE29_138, partial [Gaiellaceae bacterium]|nr:hypothetical protein [Gaiellaceae bacterium]